MTPEQIIKTAEDCGFTRTHTGEVRLWLCNKNDLANFMHVIAEDAYHCGIQEGVVAGANNEREACALESENCGAIHVAKRIRARS